MLRTISSSALLLLVLSGCGGGAPAAQGGPPPVTPKATLYQGDWDWVVMNINNSDDYVVGQASYSLEQVNTTDTAQRGNLVAAGAFDVIGINAKPYGVTLMGPISTPLDVGFTYPDGRLMIAAVDADGRMEKDDEGSDVFAGVGQFLFRDGTTSDVVVVLIQSDTTPTYRPASANAALTSVLNANLMVPGRLTGSIRAQSAGVNLFDKAVHLAGSGQTQLGRGPLGEAMRAR